MALHVGLYSPWSTDDPRAWSGVVAPMAAALRERFAVTVFPPVTQPDATGERLRTRLRGMRGRRSLPTHTMATARLRSAALADQIRAHKGEPLDALVAIASSTDVLSLPRDLPLVQVTDATFPAICGFYPIATGLGRRNEQEGLRVEQAGAAVTDHFLVASDWAARSLIGDAGVSPSRVTVAPFGPATPTSNAPRPRTPGSPLRVLAVIADWERKRGDDVVLAVKQARQSREISLTIVGRAPEGLPPWVDTSGVVDRSVLAELYREHDVLLDLALANAAGVVMTDALVSGLPVIATRVGGVETIVQDGFTGWLVAPGEAVDQTARLLGELSEATVARAAEAATRDGQARLNWQAWASAAEQAVHSALEARRSSVPSASAKRKAVMLTPVLPSWARQESAGEHLVHAIAEVLGESAELTMVTTDGPANRRALARGVPFSHRVLSPAADRRGRLERLLAVSPSLSRVALSRVRDLVAEADVIDLQWEETAILLGAIRRINPNARVVVTLHDVLSQRFGRQRKLQTSIPRRAAWAVRRAAALQLEGRIARHADDVVVLSQKDADLLPCRGTHARVHVVPPAISGHVRTEAPSSTNPLLLFVGYMARWENEDAMHWFVTEILPEVRRAHPNARVAVAGGGLREHVVAELEANAVDVLGFVDDLEPLYAEAAVVVVPLRYGAGVKFKVVEALIRGVPTVTTTVGNEGIHPADAAFVADDPRAFAASISRVLAAPDAANEHARRTAPAVAEEYGEQRFHARLQEVYR